MTDFLVDTNVLSELTRPRPDERVKAFLINAGEERVFISVVTLGEICAGIAGHSDEKRREALQHALDTVMRTWFTGRVASWPRRHWNLASPLSLGTWPTLRGLA